MGMHDIKYCRTSMVQWDPLLLVRCADDLVAITCLNVTTLSMTRLLLLKELLEVLPQLQFGCQPSGLS